MVSALVWIYAGLALAVFAWEWLLDVWNERHSARKQAEPAASGAPPSDPRVLEYLRARNRLSHAESGFFLALTLACVVGGVPEWFGALAGTLAVDRPLLGGVLTLALFFFAWDLLRVPVEWYETFRLEAAFGFNRTTPGTFVADLLKGWLVKALLCLPLAFAALWLLLASGREWWLPASALFIGFQLLVLFLYPRFIAPLFNKFEPLEEGALKTALEELAVRCRFPVKAVAVMDGSRRSGHSNAYFTGFGRNRRLVLYDTLVRQLTVEELRAVLAHEIGHYRCGHIQKLLLLMSVLVSGVMFGMSRALEWEAFRAVFHVPAGQPAVGLAVFALVAGPFLFWLGPCLHALQRRFEFQADAFAAAAAGGAAPMSSALLRLAEKNLENLTPLPLYSAWHHSHPAILERIATLEGRECGGKPGQPETSGL